MDDKIAQLKKWVDESNNIVFFGGAGVSTESGIPDFRSAGGLYSGNLDTPERPEVMLSHTYFIRHTAEFYKFYKQYMLFPAAKPNAAHRALATLEDEGILRAVVTQNIDGLHTAAGNRNVYELHGSVLRNTCMNCKTRYDLGFIMNSDGVPRCEKCGGTVKPDVVLYEEGLDRDTLEGAAKAIQEADTLIVGGTSLEVFPAAGLVECFQGRYFIIINMSPTRYDRLASLIIREPVGETLGNAVGI